MVHRIKRFNPTQTALVMGLMYLIMGILFMPVFYFASKYAPDGIPISPMFLILMPLLYGAIGAIMTGIGCLFYNLVAGWTGGIEVTVDTVEAVV
jgi:hypothetical protein